MNDTGFVLLLLLVLLGPPLAILLLGLRFWRLRQVAALTGTARQRRLAWLVALASAITGSFYLLVRTLSAEIPGAHGPATSHWSWLHEHLNTTVTLASLGITLLLLCCRSQRLAGLSFGAGALLVIGGLDAHWYLTDHQANLRHVLQEVSARYEQTGWQKAVTDSFQVQLERRSDVQRYPSQLPVFPGGEAVLQRHLLTRSPGKRLPLNAYVTVEFIVESDMSGCSDDLLF